MDKLIVLILSIVMVFGGWQVGGQPNESTAKELASKMNVSSTVAKYSIGDPDVINLEGLKSYFKQAKFASVIVSATASDGSAEATAGTYATLGAVPASYTSNSLFKITNVAKDADGNITNITVTRIKIN